MSDCQAYVRQWLPLQRLLDEPQGAVWWPMAWASGMPRNGGGRCRLDAWSAE